MKIIDKTPFRTESGEIDIMGRIRGSLSHGMNWYTRLQAQDVVIGILDKVLGDKYVLLRNVTLVDTEIELPMLLVGPQGAFLINVIHERGVYRAKDDEWGTVRGEQFVPAAINQVKRTLKLGRVAQVYLERAGFKDLLVDPILMSADPGTHIESTRPAVRVIMSDALERFAISISQGRAVLGADVVSGIAKTILNGPQTKAEPSSKSSAPMATPSNNGRDTTDALFSGTQQDYEPQGYSFDEPPRQSSQQPSSSYQSGTPRSAEPQRRSYEDSGFEDTGRAENNYQERGYQERSYQDSSSQGMDFRDSNYQDTGFGDLRSQENVFRDTDAPVSDSSQSATPPFDFPETDADVQPKTTTRRKPAAAKNKGPLGMNTTQLIILGAILLCWLLSMAGFAAYLYFNLNG